MIEYIRKLNERKKELEIRVFNKILFFSKRFEIRISMVFKTPKKELRQIISISHENPLKNGELTFRCSFLVLFRCKREKRK